MVKIKKTKQLNNNFKIIITILNIIINTSAVDVTLF